ncbi:beta-N-acetylglucosaminidase domain-containing protein [Wenjunlia vitaminophila]|uniref:beta-N-acetylglucosaminidase domain-containing protein n=1 Tax=Wenjunlia vitaminophila TaxID=76728 RepID=UPI001319DD27|nr:beta-N-acetylglucosaminidase domain-containing protein [Wenjunlia vitaminophila]
MASAEQHQTTTSDSATNGEAECGYALYPAVHSCVAGHRVMKLAGRTINLVLEDSIGENTAAKAQKLFEERGFTVTKAPQDTSGDDIDVLIGTDNNRGADHEYLNGKFEPSISVKKDDGYALRISAADRVIAIMGTDNSGAFYGVTTLDQILEQADGGLTDTLIEDYADVKFRGFIEGFYGTPWSHENRKDLMSFGGDYKMNSYLYGPKNDPYHASRWREPYPAEKLAELKELVGKGLETNVEFVWAAHVGGKIDLGSEADVQALKNKFDQMYGIGVRQFAIFFDDSATNNDQLVNFITRMDSEYIKPKGDVKPIIFCPQYYRKDSGSQATINYLKNISRFPKDVQIMWTGDNVVSPVNQSVIDWVTQYIDRPVYVWWNYPVNDLGRANYVHMGPSRGLQAGVKNVSGFASNPMNQAQASKVSLFSVADYTWNTDKYDYEQSWRDSFGHVIRDDPQAAKALGTFSANASHGLNPFDAGESLYLLPQLETFKQQFAAGEDVSDSGASLTRSFEDIVKAVDTLKAYQGTNGISRELTPWLDEMKKIAQASRNTVQGILGLGEISADDLASVQAAMNLVSERRAELKVAVSSSSRVVAQKEIVPFTEEILSLVEIRLMERLSLPPKMRGFGSTTLDYTRMLDGDMATATDSGAVVSRGAYFGVNLGRKTHINNLLIAMDDTKYYKSGVLEASVDNRTWTKVAEFETSTITAQELNIDAQFLRYRATDEFTDENTGSPNRGLSVKEFQVNVEKPAEVYTNVSTLKTHTLTFEGASAALRNVAEITLEPGDYFGFQFNRLKNARALRIDDGLKFLIPEFSADGRNWSAMSWSDQKVNEAKYVRVRNASQEAKEFALAELSVSFGGATSPSATVHNASVYSGSVRNIVDGDSSTYLWLKGSSGNRHFIFDLGSEIPVYDVLINSDKDVLSSGEIELSSDGVSWRDPITFAGARNINVVDVGGKSARYVKLTDRVQSNWLKIHEVKVNTTVKEDASVLSGDLDGLEKLLDLDIFSGVDVGNTGGELTYNNINTPDATNLILMKNSGSQVGLKVRKSVQADATGTGDSAWIDAGTFTGAYHNIDLRKYAPVAEIKLEWGVNSDLQVNELYVGNSDQRIVDVTSLKELIGRYDSEGEFGNYGSARSLEAILTVAGGFEKQGELQKAVEQMRLFKRLLDQRRQSEMVSEKAYRVLASSADYLIEKWQV